MVNVNSDISLTERASTPDSSPPIHMRGRLLDFLRRRRPQLSQETLILLCSAFFAITSNGPFWKAAYALHPGNLLFAISLFGLLIAANGLLLSLLVWRWTAKPIMTILFFTTAMAVHYMTTYGVFMDADMVRNVLATDVKESRELMTPSLILPILLHAVLPSALVWWIRIRDRKAIRTLWIRPLFMVSLLIGGFGAVMLSSADVSAMLRNHREIKYLATPLNYIVGLQQNLKSSSPIKKAPKAPIALDATATTRSPESKPRLLVLVVGETVRAQNWGLNGYSRQTTPELTEIGVVNFPDMHSCGTSTEVSVPCMFSQVGRRNYDQAKIRAEQSLLNVLDRVGIKTLWLDNQSGCKGVCDGTSFESLTNASDPQLCDKGRCLDEIMLKGLEEKVRSATGDRLVVLHQLGSHGPSYFQRYPAEFKKFTPPCENPELGNCAKQEIVNAYDNSILYTDYFLAKTITDLKAMQDYDTAMVYVSDHGESLGEKGLYLHGVPYAIAPAEQTQVPMVMWFSDGFAKGRGIDMNCLQGRARQRADHDVLFSSVLSLMQVRTSAYDQTQDVFASCIKR